MIAVFAGVSGVVLLAAALSPPTPRWERYLHATAVAATALLLWRLPLTLWWLAALGATGAAASIWMAVAQLEQRAWSAERRCDDTASQLDRRISELFSLQELSYVLSESIALDRIVEQVAKYSVRFLQADGAIVALTDNAQASESLRVVASVGSLQALLGHVGEEPATALVRLAIRRERIEVAQGVAVPTVNLIGGHIVRSAAVVPLRAHGVTMGALAVSDRREGPFTTEDLWLLSTVATQASVVLANSRLYEMVRRSTEEWETAFNALTEGIAVVGPEGTILRANESLARLASLPANELLGRAFSEVVFDNADAARGLVAAALEGSRPAPLILQSERVRRALRLTAAPLTNLGRGGSLVVLVEDVTEQRAMETQLIQNEKMASIGQLVSGVAHELNNPLTSIRGLAELLLERGPGAEPPKEHLRVIHDQAERAGRIVRNLLTFARKGAPEKGAVDLNDVVIRTALLVHYELELRGIELESRLSAEPVPVLGDRYELQQVLLNLLTNAVQAVSGLAAEQPRVVVVETERVAAHVMLRVRDTGPGVPPTLIPYLFTPFFTTKEPGQGTGLGLSLSYGIVQSHGGRLTYAPARDSGAEFCVTLPHLDSGEAARTARVEAERAAEHGRAGRRILVIDDDPGVHRLLGALFSPDGHIVETARSGPQGLRMAGDKVYDLIIVDGEMTAATGEPIVTALLAGDPGGARRLLMTGTGRISDPPVAQLDQAVRCLAKPFNLRQLRTVAREIWS